MGFGALQTKTEPCFSNNVGCHLEVIHVAPRTYSMLSPRTDLVGCDARQRRMLGSRAAVTPEISEFGFSPAGCLSIPLKQINPRACCRREFSVIQIFQLMDQSMHN